MRVSVCLTINNRLPEVSKVVSDSLLLPGNMPDEVIVVLDRPDAEAKRGAVEAYSRLNDYGVLTKFVPLEGRSGWNCPARAWNAAFEAATGDAVYCISSETIQSSGAIDMARHLLITRLRIIFGMVLCSCGRSGHAVEPDGKSSGNVLSSAAAPRPVGFVWAGHRSLVLSVGGYSNAFNGGIGHEDIDFFLRLWDLGIEFEFNDSIACLHICHNQPAFKQEEKGINMAWRNMKVFMKRHGTMDPWSRRKMIITQSPGSTVWAHEP